MTAKEHSRRNGFRSANRWAFALLLLVLGLAMAGCAPEITGAAPTFVYDPAAPAMPPERPLLSLQEDDRILILAPHPDDEVLAMGGVIQQAIAMNLPVNVVFLTNGDNNEFAFMLFSKAFTLDAQAATYAGMTRAFEAMRAGRELGLKGNEESFLGYPDFGTLEIWLNRWGEREPYRGMFNERNAVPYWFAMTPDAPYKGESILADLSQVLSDFKPTKIFVSHPADMNPDHQALYLFLRTALWDLADEIQPEIYTYLTHYGEWPQPRGLLFDAPHEPPAMLDEPGRWVVLPLEPDQVEKKLDALKRHKTQFEASEQYLETYMRANELFDTVEDIVLSPESPTAVILPSGTGVSEGVQDPEWQTDGAIRTVSVDGDELVFSFELAQPSSKAMNLDVYVMGYRSDRPFAEMPKIFVDMNGANYKLYERRQRLSDEAITASSTSTMSQLRIPLDLLENPERVFVDMAIKNAGAPLAAKTWVVIELP